MTITVMDRIRKSFRNSFRRKKSIPESIKPHQWQSDEVAVKAGNCMFSVKYLGCVEVFESRGMQICEDALRRLRNSRRRAVKGTLYVTGDGLRVVDDETKGLIVDQTIEKVSFCAPDRSHERGFSYICRDGTTRRWMCHGFHATKDSGERLSHAVGCAFAVCLERKQRRDKEAVSSVFDAKTATFTRTGSFRQSSITERMQDPQVAKAAEPPPLKPVHNPYAVERPHAAASLLQRQGSLRGGPLNHASPFKRQLSLRLGIDSLPTSLNSPAESTTTTLTNAAANSTLSNQRERAHSVDFTAKLENSNTTTTPLKRPVPSSLFQLGSKVTLAPSVAPIQEVSPNQDKSSNSILTHGTSSNEGGSSIIAAMCQELSQGLSILAAKTDDDLVSGSHPFPPSPGHFSPPAALGAGSGASFSAFDKWISTNSNGSKRPADNKPLVPPPVVDQMPQVTAPPPPSSPSYATTVTFSTQFNKSKATDYHSSLFSDLANSLKDNLANSSGLNSTCQVSNTAPSTSSPTSISTSSVSAIPTAATTTCSHNGSSDKSPSGKLDPFDADWVELSNRHMPTHVDANETVSTSAVDSCSTSSSSMFNSSTVPAVPYKSTNPFLDLSQFETASTAAAVNLPSAPPPSQPQQLITAFEVQM